MAFSPAAPMASEAFSTTDLASSAAAATGGVRARVSSVPGPPGSRRAPQRPVSSTCHQILRCARQRVKAWDRLASMSFCEHCEGQRFDRAQVLRILRDTRRRLRSARGRTKRWRWQSRPSRPWTSRTSSASTKSPRTRSFISGLSVSLHITVNLKACRPDRAAHTRASVSSSPVPRFPRFGVRLLSCGISCAWSACVCRAQDDPTGATDDPTECRPRPESALRPRDQGRPVIFQSAWHDLEAEYGHEYLRFPRRSFFWAAPRGPARGPTRRSSRRRAA